MMNIMCFALIGILILILMGVNERDILILIVLFLGASYHLQDGENFLSHNIFIPQLRSADISHSRSPPRQYHHPKADTSIHVPPLSGGYLGAIDNEFIDEGHSDARIDDVIPEGNRFISSRISAPPSDEVCIDDEANDEELDGDERINYQSLSRNDSTRVTAGTVNRTRMMNNYLREEVEETEARPWWGRHEL